MKPIRCSHCKAQFAVDDVSVEERDLLSKQNSYWVLVRELQMLRKVASYCERHPEVDINLDPHFIRVLDSKDPAAMEQRNADVPFSQIELPPDREPPVDNDADREVVEYLKGNYFDPDARLRFVEERVNEDAEAIGKVHCWSCGEGKLEIEDFNAFEASISSVVFYRPCSSEIGEDGTISMSASGWDGGTHWSGWVEIPTDSDNYEYWIWLVAQKNRPQRITSDELPVVIEKWKRRKVRRWWQFWR